MSVLPFAVARTAKVCGPLDSPEYGCGDVQAANVGESSEHSNVDGEADVELKRNVAAAAVIVADSDGLDSITVSGPKYPCPLIVPVAA
jgi:hypothetical protein